MRGKKIRNIIITFLLSLMMIVTMAPISFAAGEDKTVTVEVDGEYKTVQEAINYINEQTDKTGWTIEVKAGTYPRFTVLDGMDNLTVKAVAGNEVIVETLNNSEPPVPVSGSNPDSAGVSVRNVDGVLIDGLIFTVGTQTAPWYSASVSNYSESTEKGDNISVRNCTFYGQGSGIGVFINSGTTAFNVTDCELYNLKEAISMYGDGTLLRSAEVSGNKFNECNFAIHGYYGGKGNAGTLSFINNEVNGTEDLRSKIVIQDQVNTGALKAVVKGNKLSNAIVGLVNLREDGEMNDVLKDNTFTKNSHFVEAVEPGTIEFYSTYKVPEGSNGYWKLTDIDDIEVDWGKNPQGALEYVKKAIAEANAKGSKELSITGIDEENLIKTFTWFKDAIYWVETPAEPENPVTPPGTDTPGTSGDDKTPATGDSSNPVLWAVLMALAAAGAIAVGTRRAHSKK